MWRDAPSALRSLRRDPGFAALAITLLALTSGATTALFSVLYAVVLQPLGIGDADRTVVIWEYDSARSTPVVEVGLGEAEDWLGESSPLEAVAVFSSVPSSIAVIRGETRMRARSRSVSRSFFEIAGARPRLGRAFSTADHAESAPQTAVISEAFWRRAFGADPAIVGQTLEIQRDRDAPSGTVEIVGVVADVDLPARRTSGCRRNRSSAPSRPPTRGTAMKPSRGICATSRSSTRSVACARNSQSSPRSNTWERSCVSAIFRRVARPASS
ncbi:MAG: ABC transporter permease [Vicinamibacterales bacterium]